MHNCLYMSFTLYTFFLRNVSMLLFITQLSIFHTRYFLLTSIYNLNVNLFLFNNIYFDNSTKVNTILKNLIKYNSYNGYIFFEMLKNQLYYLSFQHPFLQTFRKRRTINSLSYEMYWLLT